MNLLKQYPEKKLCDYMTLKSQSMRVYQACIQRPHVNIHIRHLQEVYRQISFSTLFT